jgi:phage repressor protein C with HTH and peptisase S24 domain
MIDTRVKTFVADAAYVFRYDGMVLIKRLQWIGNGTVQILSENS